MNLFEIAYLEDDQASKFKSDFRLVADYFVQMRKTGKYVAPDDSIIHVQEMLSLMSALTDDDRFVDTYDRVKGKERISMCTVLDEIEEKAKSEDVKKLADYLCSQNSDLTYEDAIKMAEGILKR